MANRDAISKAIRILVACGSAAPFGMDDYSATAEAWEARFSSWSDAHLFAAVNAWTASPDARRWPTPYDLRAMLVRQADPEEEGTVAYGRLCRLLGRHGIYDPPQRPEEEDEPGRWRLDQDPEEERRLWMGLDAIGGPRGWALAEINDPTLQSRFRRAYASAIRQVEHARRIGTMPALEDRGRAVAALVDSVADGTRRDGGR